MEFNDAQRAALSHKEGPMMVLAGPGSGKTTVITHRIQRLLEQGVSPSGILVITFTKAAAAEMKERFLKLADQAGMDREIGKRGKRYSKTQNMDKPVITYKVVSSSSWRKEPKARKGAVLYKFDDGATCRAGWHEMTGYPYQEYFEVFNE